MPAELDLDTLRRQAEAPGLAQEGDLEGVAADLAAAFADDPVVDWILRDDGRREAARLALFRLLIRVSVPQRRRIERPAGGGAAAIWIASEHLRRTTLADELRATVGLARACGLKRLSRASRLRAAMDAHHPKARAHDYLSFLGVRPEAQGRGVGSRLLKAHLAGLDAAGRPAFLETGQPRTLSLYRSHGFEVTGEYRPDGDGPTMWSMWREPQAC